MNKQRAEQIITNTKEDYNRIAPQFDSTRKYNWRDIANIIDDLNIKKGARVLDLGCGGGRLYEVLEKYHVEYTGLDNSNELIKIARRKYPKAVFKIGDVTKIDTEEKYDYVFSIAALHHVPSRELREKTVKDIKKILKNKGTAIISVWYFWNQPKYIKEIAAQFLKLPNTDYQLPNEDQNNNFKTRPPAGGLIIHNSRLPWGDFYVPWKNQNGEIMAQRFHHAWTARELKKMDFTIISKNKNLIGIYKKIIFSE